jgi:hypothetical protein
MSKFYKQILSYIIIIAIIILFQYIGKWYFMLSPDTYHKDMIGTWYIIFYNAFIGLIVVVCLALIVFYIHYISKEIIILIDKYLND